jgi:hypothetical protein
MSTHRWPAVAVIAWLTLASGYNAYVLNTPPAPVPADAPADEFSAERAYAHIQECAKKPHPIGSVENARVRDYLFATLQGIGYEAFIQRDPLYEGKRQVSLPENVYARLKGTDSTGAVLLMAHYDSVPFGPGAADDITGVATIIETARALKNGPPLRNDIIFFLTDGEERGLLGPKAFLQSHPWRADLKMVLNFEARGHRGPSMMFHTNERNGGLVREFLKAAPYPVSSSMMFDVAGRMPTTTDYWVMKRAGIPGMDFAFVGGLKYYHTMNDSPEHIDHGTIQHHGSYAHALSRHFAEIDLNTVAWDAEPMIYFNTLGHNTIHYDRKWIWPVTVLSVIAALAAVLIALVRGRARPTRILGGIGIHLLALLLVPVAAFVPIYLGFSNFGFYTLYNQPYYVAGLVLLTISVYLGVFALLSRRYTAEERASATLLLSIPVAITITVYVPLGGYVAAWPLFFAALGVAALALLPESLLGLRAAVATAAASPALFLILPSLFSFFDTITVAPAPIMLTCLVLLLGFLLQALHFVIQWRARALALALFLVSLPLLGHAITNTEFSPQRPKMNSVDFGANFDTHQACWASKDRTPDDWTAQFFGTAAQCNNFAEFTLSGSEPKRTGAGVLPKASDARIEITADQLVDGQRHIAATVWPGTNTSEFTLFTPPSVDVIDATILGYPHGKTKRMPFASWLIEYVGRAEQGVPLTFTLAPGAAFQLTLIETRFGLPEYDGEPPFKPRPDYMIPEPNTTPTWDFSAEGLRTGNVLDFHPGWNSNRTFLRKTFTF